MKTFSNFTTKIRVELGQTEVCNDCSSFREEDIGRFEVSVHNSFLSHVLEAFPKIQDNFTDLVLFEGNFSFDFIIEVAIEAVFCDYVAVAFREKGLNKAEDVGVFELLQYFDFLKNKFFKVSVFEFIKGYHFYSDYFLCNQTIITSIQVYTLINLCEIALSDEIGVLVEIIFYFFAGLSANWASMGLILEHSKPILFPTIIMNKLHKKNSFNNPSILKLFLNKTGYSIGKKVRAAVRRTIFSLLNERT